MFGKKPAEDSGSKLEEKLGPDTKIDEKIDQNLLVHKMPKNYKITGNFSYQTYFQKAGDDKTVKSPSAGQGSGSYLAPHHKSRKIGLVIIGGGALLIGALVYGLIVYLGQSTTKKVNTPTATSTNNIEMPSITSPIATSSLIATTTEIATTTDIIATSTEIATTTIISSSTIAVALPDDDSDALNNAEEKLFGTSNNNPDTDGDGYNDLTEIIGLYDPIGPGKLADNLNIKKYTNPSYKYSVLYPSVWTAETNTKSDSAIIKAEDQSFVQIAVEANTKKQSIKDWYLAQFNLSVANSQVIKGNGWEGVRSTDDLTVYIADNKKNNIYIISYTPLELNKLVYKNVFEMMIKSLSF